jgi:hypothetical protein
MEFSHPLARGAKVSPLKNRDGAEQHLLVILKWTPFAGPRAVEIKVESRLPFLSSFFSFETL